MLREWWNGRGRKNRTPAEIVLYTRHGCHLCDDARSLLEAVGQTTPLTIRVIDVDSDPELVSRFGHEVPVVAIDGRVRFRGRVNRMLLERQLRNRE